MAALCVLGLWALFSPAFAYSGPGLSHGRVAYDMSNQYRLTHRWPLDERDHALNRVPAGRSYSYRLMRTLKHGAAYRIVVDGKTEVWRSNEVGRPKRLLVE